MKVKNEKIVIKSKNVNSNKEHKEHKEYKGDKFFEELKKKRMMGNK